MRAVVQRVKWARVTVDGEITGEIEKGLCVLLGVTHDDSDRDVLWMADKVSNLRIFEDDEGKLNLSLMDVGGGILVVSQFTLYGDCRKGRRPSFVKAASPGMAKKLYEDFLLNLKKRKLRVGSGVFQTHMEVELCNDGPVTLVIDTPEKRQEEK